MAKTDSLTVARLREVLNYDCDTGIFTRRIATGYRGRNRAGEIAGRLKDGYIVIGIDSTAYRANRLAWLYMTGEWPPALVDHENTNKADNRWINLRVASKSQNGQNRRGAQINSKSGALGVSPSRHKWAAVIHLNGRKKHLGYFDTIELASAAYQEAKSRLHPFCAQK